MRRFSILIVASGLLLATAAKATIFGSLRGMIHDPQHRPVEGTMVMMRAKHADWAESTTTDSNGQFRFSAVPLGEYTISVASPGFIQAAQDVVVNSGSDLLLHFQLKLAGSQQTVTVSASAETVATDSATPTTLVNRDDIANTPGASRSNSLAAITNYTPGAYITHDQLHIRGGHQVSWLLDGVPVPNTGIASNVGPQFDPKDVDSIEVQRGGYSADYGDRTYGVFNVVTRSGFERNREAELVASYGSFNHTNDQLSFGDHSDRFAYYGSLTGYRTDLALETPVPQVINDQAAGLSGFTSLILNKDPSDQLRLIASARGDHYQVPIDPAGALHDVEKERDDFLNFTWLHMLANRVELTVSPFYHFNSAHYVGGPEDAIRSDYDRRSNYFGGVSTIGVTSGPHNFHAGVQVFGERDNQLYAVGTNSAGRIGSVPPTRTIPWANTDAVFAEEQYKATSWLTFNGGVRFTHYGGPIGENVADPRIGAAIQVPDLGWVFHAFYGRYYQAPPLVTVNNASLNQLFLPLHGERDEQYEFGLTVPVESWIIDVSNFRTGARNYFDHDALGDSDVFFPVTLSHARIRAWEITAKSPRIVDRAQFHLTYSHQYAEWSGSVTGGLIGGSSCFTLCFLDHDQRDTVSVGFTTALPWKSSADFNV